MVQVWQLQFRQDPTYVYRKYDRMIVYKMPFQKQRWILNDLPREAGWVSVMRRGSKQYFESQNALQEFYSRKDPQTWYNVPGSYSQMWNEYQ